MPKQARFPEFVGDQGATKTTPWVPRPSLTLRFWQKPAPQWGQIPTPLQVSRREISSGFHRPLLLRLWSHVWIFYDIFPVRGNVFLDVLHTNPRGSMFVEDRFPSQRTLPEWTLMAWSWIVTYLILGVFHFDILWPMAMSQTDAVRHFFVHLRIALTEKQYLKVPCVFFLSISLWQQEGYIH